MDMSWWRCTSDRADDRAPQCRFFEAKRMVISDIGSPEKGPETFRDFGRLGLLLSDYRRLRSIGLVPLPL